MAQKVMYPGMVNSPETTITNNINESDTIIYVLDPARVPEPPNLMTLGTGTNAETVKVTEINDSAITVERGFQGIAKSWPAGTVIARNFTEYDYQAMKKNIEELDENLGDLAGEGRTTETVKGIADDLDSHLADYASMKFGSIPYTTTQDVTYYVDEVNGNDSNDGLTSGTAFKTWAKVESMIPMFVSHRVNIRVIGNISRVYLYNRVISNTLTIIGDTEDKANHVMSFSSSVPFRGIVGGSGISTRSSIDLQYFTINENFVVTGCTSFGLRNMSLRQISFAFSKANTVFCEYNGTGNGISAEHQSHVTSLDASGEVDGYGLYAMYGSVIAKRGSQPTGGTANEFTQYGGVIR